MRLYKSRLRSRTITDHFTPLVNVPCAGGANPSQADSAATSTPLHLVASCGAGNLAIYRALARRGAATNALNKHGMSALHLAIQSAAASGAADCAFDAIAQGITETEASNVNLATADGAHITPMLMCIKGARPTVLTSLIKRRADANVASKVGELPLLAALEKAGRLLAVWYCSHGRGNLGPKSTALCDLFVQVSTV